MAGAAAVGAATTLGWAGTAQAATVPVFSDGFEGGDLSLWDRARVDGNGVGEVVTTPVHQGSHAARFTVPNDGESYRSEIALDPTFGPGTYRYSWFNLLPEDWVIDETAVITGQWHGYPLINGKSTNPPIAINVKADRWRLTVNHLVDPVTTARVQYDLGPIVLGHWNAWDVRIDWTTNTRAGRIVVRRDGKLVGMHRGVNHYQQNQLPYVKFGLYKANWNPAKGIDYPTGGPDVEMFYDTIAIDRLPPGTE